MTTPARYFDLVREMSNPYNHRLRLIESAKQRGIKPTAQLFSTTVPTARKWLRRYQQRGPSGLVEQPRARLHQPQKTPPVLEAQLVQLRKTLPTFGARRVIREFDLPVGHGALERIWRSHGLIQKRRRKYQRKQDLAHIKAQWALFQQISAATKDLDDIPHYWPQAQSLDLPAVQYTAREVRSGLLFWSFAERRSQRRLRRAHPAAPGSLRRRVHRRPRPQRKTHRLPRRPARQPASAHPARRTHLSERRRNRSPHRRR
jgi:transposase